MCFKSMIYVPGVIELIDKNKPLYKREKTEKNPKNLTINVNISDKEVEDVFYENCDILNNRIIDINYYESYLKHIFGKEYDKDDLDRIFLTLNNMKEHVDYGLSVCKPHDRNIVISSLQKNNYFSKNTNRPGVTVKLFTAEYKDKISVIKTYMYDGHSQELKWSLEQNIKHEILFQNYAKTLNKPLGFISPELYSWGEIRGYKPFEDSDRYKVRYLIMEYIPYMTLKQCSQLSNITEIYERVDMIEHELNCSMLHHNDIHSSNILVSCNSPLPEICILDFGEASYGPRNTIG